MKIRFSLVARLGVATVITIRSIAASAADNSPPAVYQGAAPAPAAVAESAPVGAPAAQPAPPPSAAPKRSAADLEKLVAPIALYPDPLIATLLPASVYPLEIVQAARFVADTNNLAKLDAQPWDENVKAVARIPEAIKKMNDDISWTIELGEAFLAQDKDVMDAIQKLRGNAQKMGALQTTSQQVVIVTNTVVERTVNEKVVVVTNTIVQIQPSNPQVIYVPQYPPTYLYAPPPAYVYNPLAPLVTFGAAVAVGAIIANNCDWYHGGCYHGGGGSYYRGGDNININNEINIDRNTERNTDRNTGSGRGEPRASTTDTPKKWQPDQSRLSKSGSPGAAASAGTREARGWGSGSSPGSAARPSTGTGSVAARPSTGTGAGAARPSTGMNPGATRPSTGATPAARPSASPSVSRPSPSASPSVNRASPSPSRSSAFSSGGSGSSTRSMSSRGATSRGGGGFSGGGGGRGGGGRGR